MSQAFVDFQQQIATSAAKAVDRKNVERRKYFSECLANDAEDGLNEYLRMENRIMATEPDLDDSVVGSEAVAETFDSKYQVREMARQADDQVFKSFYKSTVVKPQFDQSQLQSTRTWKIADPMIPVDEF